MKKITRYPVPTSLHSGQKFCILHSGCTAKSLIYMGFGGNSDCRMQPRKNRLHSEKPNVYQPLRYQPTLHCRPPISYRDREVIPADAVLPLSYCVRVARAQEVV